ncbi:ribosomal protein S9 containing protein [Ditylenchus destructor]|nr:ribosomal protein S9 containing protein [Ditylenchus destructor]
MLNRLKLGVKVCLQSQNCHRPITTRPPWVPPGKRFTPSPASGSNAIPLGNQPSPVTQRSKPKVQDPALDEQLTERQRRLKNISQALRIYIDQKREQDKMVAEERAQFELGKRYLANMMGWDPKAEIQQEDIDKAIRYLFPASLTDSKAEPIMKPPEEWLPNFRAIEVDEEGRPKDTYFYTLRPKLYRLLTDIAAETQHAIELCKGKTLKSITEKEERFNKQQIPKWVTAEEISNIIGEKINEPMYVNVKAALDYRDSIPTPSGETSIMEKFRAAGGGLRLKKIFGHFRPVILYGKTKTGERYKYTEVKVRVKRCYMLVKVKYPGTGKIIVNGISYDEYRSLLSREVLLSPMLITDLFGKIDIVSKVIPGVNGEVSVGGHIIFPRTTSWITDI